jgi:hypothetical protein
VHEIHQDFFIMLPSRETELSTPKVTHEFIHEFGKSDVSKVRFLPNSPTNTFSPLHRFSPLHFFIRHWA